MARTIFRIFAFLIVVFILTPACISPRYYGDYQVPNVNQPQIDTYSNKKATLQIAEESYNLADFENKQSYYARHYYYYAYPKSVKRSFSNQPIELRVDGFEPYKTELKSKVTDDKWAVFHSGANMSGAFLMLPSNMASIFYDITSEGLKMAARSAPETYGASLLTTPIVIVGGAIASVAMLPFDIINMTINGPSVAIKNPWFEYETLDLSKIVLTPTAELKEKCNKDGLFISNIGCTKCNISNVEPISSLEECNRCNNRTFNNNVCQLKKVEK